MPDSGDLLAVSWAVQPGPDGDDSDIVVLSPEEMNAPIRMHQILNVRRVNPGSTRRTSLGLCHNPSDGGEQPNCRIEF